MEPLEQAEMEEPLLEAGAEGEAELPEELDPATLAAQLAELRAENERTQKRLADTQAWAHQTNQERQQLQAALAQAATTPQRQAPPPQQQQVQIPQLSEEEAERFATDPQYAFRKMYELASGAARYATEQATQAAAQKYEPVINQLYAQAQATGSMLPAAVEPAANAAAFQAADLAEKTIGIPKDQFAASLDAGTQMLWDSVGGDLAQFNRLRMNPSAVMHAVLEARIRSGGAVGPVHKPVVPPSAGGSLRTAPAPSRRTEVSASVAAINEKLGVKLTPEEAKYVMTGVS